MFKWDEALSFERGCASIQYAHARACKLLEKVGEFNSSDVDIDSLDLQNMDTLEIDLLKTLANQYHHRRVCTGIKGSSCGPVRP